MAKKSFVFTMLLLLLGATVYYGPQLIGANTVDRPTIKVASWNIENFGQKKANDPDVMAKISSVLKDYDIVAIQEISNVDERIDKDCGRNADACPGSKCNLINDALMAELHELNYSIIISNHVKDERYAFVFDQDKVQLVEDVGLLVDPLETGAVCDTKHDDQGLMARQPYLAKFKAGDWEFSLLTAHTSPSINDVELEGLSTFYDEALDHHTNTVLLGDLNLDCSYLPKGAISLEKHRWLLPDSFDTTVSKTDCTYDQIIIPQGLKSRYAKHRGVDTRVTDDMSDHYLVWAEFFTDSSSE